MKTRKIGSEVFRLIREGNYDQQNKDILTIRGERMTSNGKKSVDLEMSDDFISILVSNQIGTGKAKGMDIHLYVYSRIDKSLWVGSMIKPTYMIESKLVAQASVEYMCALNSMKHFIGDLFLMRPYDMRVLEVMDIVGDKRSKSSIEGYLRVLYKMVAND